MINNHLYSRPESQRGSGSWQRWEAALLRRLSFASPLQHSPVCHIHTYTHTHTHFHRSKEIWKHTNIKDIVQKNSTVQDFSILGVDPPPPNGTFSSRFYALFFLCNWDRGFFNPTVENYSVAFITLYYKKLQQLSSSSKIIQSWGSTCTKDTPTSFWFMIEWSKIPLEWLNIDIHLLW